MGRGKKPAPKNLSKKLSAVRKLLRLSQEEMVRCIIPNVEDTEAARATISDYERGHRSPSILELLNYTESVRLLSDYKDFSMEDLADDNKLLPWLKK